MRLGAWQEGATLPDYCFSLSVSAGKSAWHCLCLCEVLVCPMAAPCRSASGYEAIVILHCIHVHAAVAWGKTLRVQP